MKNVKFGLGTFNNKVVDHSWIYPNYGHGFLDPLMGILLWVGVAIVGLGLIRRRRDDEGALLMLGGFVALWLAFALLVNKAPNYTRLLITLPFVAYLVVEALRWATNRWRSVRYAPQLIVGVFVVAVVALNVSAARDYVQLGRKQGEPIGSTGRFAAARDDVPGQKFYVASSETQPYYEWGNLGPGERPPLAFHSAGDTRTGTGRPDHAEGFPRRPAVRALHAPRDLAADGDGAVDSLSARTDPQRHARRLAGRARRSFVSPRLG